MFNLQHKLMDNQLDALKKHWKSLDSVNIVDTPCEDDCISRTLAGKSIVNRRKLLRFYSLLSIISGVYVVLGPAMLLPLGLFPLWGLVLLSVFFGVCMAMNIYMYNLIDDIDFARMPTLELLYRVRKAYRVHIRQTFIGIILLIPMLTLMLAFFYAEPATLLGGIVGGIVGGLIGWRNNRRVIRYLREIESEIKSVYE